MIKVEVKGDWSRTNRFLERALEAIRLGILDKYGRKGVVALKEATPKDTGKTADSWYYEIEHKREGAAIYWMNSNVNKGIPIAILIQYGHGTGSGGYVKGTDFINPSMKAIFDELAEEAWREVTGDGND